MHRFWLIAAAAGLGSAVIFLAGLSGSMATKVLANLSPAPLFAAALALGAFGGIVASITSTVLVLLAGGVVTALVFAAVTAAPAAILGRQAMLSRRLDDGSVEWFPPGALVAWLYGIGCAVFLAVALFLGTQAEGFSGTVHAAISEMASALPVDQKELFVAAFAPVLPGAAVAMWMLLLVLNGALAQGMLVAGKQALRPSPDIGAMVLPGWIAPVGAAVAVAAIALGGDAGYAARNLLIVMMVPFFLQGIAVVHMLARRTGGGRSLLAVFYVMLVIIGWVGVLIALLGLVEQFVHIRARMASRGKT